MRSTAFAIRSSDRHAHETMGALATVEVGVRHGLVAVCATLTIVAAACGSPTSSDEARAFIEIEFDGETCTVPITVTPTGGATFVLTNSSMHDDAWLVVGSLVDGHTYQDLVDAQEAAGGPPSSPDTHMDWFPHEMSSFDPADSPQMHLGTNQTMHPVVLTEGLDAIAVATSPPSPLMWLCGPLTVTNG